MRLALLLLCCFVPARIALAEASEPITLENPLFRWTISTSAANVAFVDRTTGRDYLKGATPSPCARIRANGRDQTATAAILADGRLTLRFETNAVQVVLKVEQRPSCILLTVDPLAAPTSMLLFSAPVEGRYISWYSAVYGYDGFLRWAYDAWPADPMRDARHTLWPAGDCFLIYPGGNSSIRFEKLREGIVDYEKIRIFRKLVSESTSGTSKELMKEFEAQLRGFVGDRDFSKREYDVAKMTEAVQKGKAMIETLSNALGK